MTTTMRIDLTDLQTVRFRCKRCENGVVEVNIKRLEMAVFNNTCRFCGQGIIDDPNSTKLKDLQKLLVWAAAPERDFTIHFDLPMATATQP